MILEHALLEVKAEEREDFVTSMREAIPIIESAPGCHGAEVRPQVEDATIHLLLVRWSTIEDHFAFRESERFARWRALTHRHYAVAPSVTHFRDSIGT